MADKQRIGLIQMTMSISNPRKQPLQNVMKKRLWVARLIDRRAVSELLVKFQRVRRGMRRLWIRGYMLRGRCRLWWRQLPKFDYLVYILVAAGGGG
jgi:hypothetical protein